MEPIIIGKTYRSYRGQSYRVLELSAGKVHVLCGNTPIAYDEAQFRRQIMWASSRAKAVPYRSQRQQARAAR